jgi:hypothetical protein
MMETLHSGPAAISMDGIYRRQRFIYDATRRCSTARLHGLDISAAMPSKCASSTVFSDVSPRRPGSRFSGCPGSTLLTTWHSGCEWA